MPGARLGAAPERVPVVLISTNVLRTQLYFSRWPVFSAVNKAGLLCTIRFLSMSVFFWKGVFCFKHFVYGVLNEEINAPRVV